MILNPRLIAERKAINKFPLSDTAYVHRMFSLFFALESQPIKDALTDEENADLNAFLVEFKKLEWKVIDTHPHISELDDVSVLARIREAAKRLDYRLARRTSNDPVSIGFRLMRGWRVLEPKRPTSTSEASTKSA